MEEKRHPFLSAGNTKWNLDGKQEGGSVRKTFFCGFQAACSKNFLLSKFQPIQLHTNRREAVAAGVDAGSCSWQPSALAVPWGSSGHRYLNTSLNLFLCCQALGEMKLLRRGQYIRAPWRWTRTPSLLKCSSVLYEVRFQFSSWKQLASCLEINCYWKE